MCCDSRHSKFWSHRSSWKGGDHCCCKRQKQILNGLFATSLWFFAVQQLQKVYWGLFFKKTGFIIPTALLIYSLFCHGRLAPMGSASIRLLEKDERRKKTMKCIADDGQCCYMCARCLSHFISVHVYAHLVWAALFSATASYKQHLHYQLLSGGSQGLIGTFPCFTYATIITPFISSIRKWNARSRIPGFLSFCRYSFITDYVVSILGLFCRPCWVVCGVLW